MQYLIAILVFLLGALFIYGAARKKLTAAADKFR